MGYRLSLCQEWGIPQNPPYRNNPKFGKRFELKKIRYFFLCELRNHNIIFKLFV